MESAGVSSDSASRLPVYAPVAAGAALLILVGVLGSIGEPFGPLTGLLIGADRWAVPGVLALAYVGGAYGLGTLCSWAWRGADEDSALRLAVGLGLMLGLSHLMGVLGILSLWAAWAPVAVGLVAAGASARSGMLKIEPRAGAVLWLVPGALLIVASASTPGWLWSSEFGGFDALSYHLQLPKEWIAGGRIWPVEHNVYSYLPSSMESAFVHVGVMGGGSAGNGGMLAFDGRGLISAQVLHALFGVCGAWVIVRLVVSLCDRIGIGEDRSNAPAWIAGALVLATPWVIVVGSLAYNEMAVVALGGGAMLVANQAKISPWVRGAICGLLVGGACGAKPTALFLVGGPTGVLLLGLAPRREWMRLVVGGCAVGLLALSPWLIRNWLASGNPVFPHASGVFGSGHWTAEQVQRYASGHAFGGGAIDRLLLIMMPDPASASDAPSVARWRGVSNPQWLLFWPMVVMGGAMAFRDRDARRAAVLLVVGLVVGLVSWAALTHVQSRFLIPLVAPAAALVGMGLACGCGGRLARGVLGLGVAAVIVQTGASVALFTQQGGGRPNLYMLVSADNLTGASGVGAGLDDAGPDVLVNRGLPAGSRVYLLGGSTPLYLTGNVGYHTTWDGSAFGDAVRAAPDDPASWSVALRGLGFTHVRVDAGELSRLGASGWYDPGVTPEAVSAWLGAGNRPVRTWPELGVMVLELTTDTTR